MGDCFKEVNFWAQCASSNMVFKVQEETWLDDQEIHGTILCERECPEETVSRTPELVLSSSTVVHSEVNVDFEVYYRFA